MRDTIHDGIYFGWHYRHISSSLLLAFIPIYITKIKQNLKSGLVFTEG